MTALLVIVWTLIGFVGGVVIFGELSGLPAMEGQAGMFGLFVGGPLGALCGGVFGYGLAKRFAGDLKKQRIALGASVLGVVVVVVGAVTFEMVRTWDWLDSSGQTQSLSYRIRLPADAPTPAGKSAGFELRSEKENVVCNTYDYPHGLTREENRWILSGDCKIRYATPKRVLWVRIGGGPNLLFRLRAQARFEVIPYSVSAWYPVDEVLDTASGSKPRPPKADEAGYDVLLSAR